MLAMAVWSQLLSRSLAIVCQRTHCLATSFSFEVTTSSTSTTSNGRQFVSWFEWLAVSREEERKNDPSLPEMHTRTQTDSRPISAHKGTAAAADWAHTKRTRQNWLVSFWSLGGRQASTGHWAGQSKIDRILIGAGDSLSFSSLLGIIFGIICASERFGRQKPSQSVSQPNSQLVNCRYCGSNLYWAQSLQNPDQNSVCVSVWAASSWVYLITRQLTWHLS